MAVTTQDIDNLNAAIASGERVVVLNGQSVTFRSIDDLIKARTDLRNELAMQTNAAAGTVRPARTHLYYAGRGY